MLSEHSLVPAERSPEPVERSLVPAERSPVLSERSPELSERSLMPAERSPVLSERSPVPSERSPVLSEHSLVLSERSPVLSETLFQVKFYSEKTEFHFFDIEFRSIGQFISLDQLMFFSESSPIRYDDENIQFKNIEVCYARQI